MIGIGMHIEAVGEVLVLFGEFLHLGDQVGVGVGVQLSIAAIECPFNA